MHTCNDPSCKYCEFKREHPQEDRVSLIFTVARVLEMMIETDVVCMKAQQNTGWLLDQLGLDEKEFECVMGFDDIIKHEMIGSIKRNPRLLLHIRDMLDTCMALIPNEVFTHAQGVAMTHIMELAKKQGRDTSGVEADNAVEAVDRVCRGIRFSGNVNLAGDNIPEPNQMQ